jgi:dipeptidyl aminopeptidase/acylaminoacyl peptidase
VLERAVPETVSFSNGTMSWSPDGKRLAIEQQSGVFTGGVQIVEPDSPNPFGAHLLLGDGVRLRGIAWSRDGSALVVGRIQRSGDIFLAERSLPR